MGKFIVFLVLVGAVAGGVYLFVVKGKKIDDIKKDIRQGIDVVEGYSDAKTAQEAVDLYVKAIKERKYDTAAKYCTKSYAEQLTRAATAAKELGVSIDDLLARMEQSGVKTSEMESILFINDPLPKSLKLTITNSKENEAIVAIQITDVPYLKADPKGSWKWDPLFVKGLYGDFGNSVVKVVKEGDIWKIDFPVTPLTRARVDRLDDKYKDYKIAFDKLSLEIKRDATSKDDTQKRLQDLLNEAVTATK